MSERHTEGHSWHRARKTSLLWVCQHPFVHYAGIETDQAWPGANDDVYSSMGTIRDLDRSHRQPSGETPTVVPVSEGCKAQSQLPGAFLSYTRVMQCFVEELLEPTTRRTSPCLLWIYPGRDHGMNIERIAIRY